MKGLLSAENQSALEALLTGIEANENRLGIFIAVCDDSGLKQEIIEAYERELAPEFRHYRLTLDQDEPNLKGLIAQQVAGDEALQPGVPAVMTILGSERLFSLRLGKEKSQQEELFGYLQWTREGLRSLPYAIVLWVSYQMQKSLSRKAPDFWSWRQDVVRFVSPKRSAIVTDTFDRNSPFTLNLPEEVGETLPVADLEALIVNTETQSPESPLLASLYLQAGKAYAARVEQGAAQSYVKEIERATSYLEKSAQLTKTAEPNEDYASSIAWLASLYESQGRYEEAEPLYLQALEQRRKLLGEEHPDVATSLNNLAGLYKSQGRYEEAEPLYLQALELLDEEHPAVATSLNNLAVLYESQGRYEEAEPLYLQALEQRRKLLGEEHPAVATSLNNLAELYRNQGRYEEAEPLYLQALELWRKLLGQEHPAVATSLNNLAVLYESQGRYEEAEPLYLQALEQRRKLLGEEHPDVATSLNNLANLYNHQGRYEEAEPLYLQDLEISRKLLGEEHPDVATSLNNLGALYYAKADYVQAEPLFVESLAIRKQKLGIQHPWTVGTQQWLEDTRSHLRKD